jgi:hypothetical protein
MRWPIIENHREQGETTWITRSCDEDHTAPGQAAGFDSTVSQYNIGMSRRGPSVFSRFNTKGLLLVIGIVFAAATWANAEMAERAPVFPDAPSELPVISRPLSAAPSGVQPPAQPPVPRAPHSFWDARNRLLFAGVAVFRALDYASTRNMQARGREEILIPDEVANNDQGFAALEGAATATSIALSYWMHRTGHHSLERWISIAHISVTGFGVVRNYSLESKHALPTLKATLSQNPPRHLSELRGQSF